MRATASPQGLPSGAFPDFASLDPPAREAMAAAAQVRLAAGAVVFEAGQECRQFLVVLEGGVRVQLLDAHGHEIVLYRVGPGQTCVLTTAALLGPSLYAATGITEGDTLALALPAQAFSRLVDASAGFRRFVFATYSRRLTEMMQVVASVAFGTIPARLARCLLDRADPIGAVRMTHEAIAIELGTAREVVSRNLKLLEHRGLVRLHSGLVELVDPGSLGTIAGGATDR